jgi:nucleotide-binding universal stress UspA family protein
MYKHLLIASDGSDLAEKAVHQGLGLAKALEAKVTAVNVTEPWSAHAVGETGAAFPIEDYERAAAANVDRILSAARKAATNVDVTCETMHVRNQFPDEGIIGAAESLGCDLIVMGSHGRRGITKFLLGSAVNRVVAAGSGSARTGCANLRRTRASRELGAGRDFAKDGDRPGPVRWIRLFEPAAPRWVRRRQPDRSDAGSRARRD